MNVPPISTWSVNVRLLYSAGFTPDEIAEILKCSVALVRIEIIVWRGRL